MTERCTEPGCEEFAEGQAYKSQRYCSKHYQENIDGELFATFNDWTEGGEPPARFKYMLGRASDEQKWQCNEGYLSMARIRDRTYSFKKTATGCIFKITRHPGGHTAYIPSRRVVQTWEADLTSKTLTLSKTRKWRKGDPDPGWDGGR